MRYWVQKAEREALGVTAPRGDAVVPEAIPWAYSCDKESGRRPWTWSPRARVGRYRIGHDDAHLRRR